MVNVLTNVCQSAGVPNLIIKHFNNTWAISNFILFLKQIVHQKNSANRFTKCLHRGYYDIFSVRSNFISPNEHQKQKIQVLMFMSEIKFDLTLKKSNFLFLLCFYSQKLSFYLLFDTHVRKQTFFPSHFASIWSCSACLGCIILGKNAVLYLENKAK